MRSMTVVRRARITVSSVSWQQTTKTEKWVARRETVDTINLIMTANTSRQELDNKTECNSNIGRLSSYTRFPPKFPPTL
jgi:hypothetical protein